MEFTKQERDRLRPFIATGLKVATQLEQFVQLKTGASVRLNTPPRTALKLYKLWLLSEKHKIKLVNLLEVAASIEKFPPGALSPLPPLKLLTSSSFLERVEASALKQFPNSLENWKTEQRVLALKPFPGARNEKSLRADYAAYLAEQRSRREARRTVRNYRNNPWS